MTFEQRPQWIREGDARLCGQPCTPQREWPVQRPWIGTEELVMCTKLISEYLLGRDYKINRLLPGCVSQPEKILPLGYLKGYCQTLKIIIYP